jgi:muramoyltetrapeptide carboxypeptidase
MKNILAPRLSKDKAIGVIAPASPVAGRLPEAFIERGYDYLQKKGYSVIVGESVKKSSLRSHNSIENRVDDIHKFVKNNNIGCIMSYWGGLNSNQLLEYLDYDLIRNNPKIIIGFSDMTAITTAITKKTGLVTFSGPAVLSFSKPEPFDYTWNYFETVCIRGDDNVKIIPSFEYADDLFYLRKDDDYRIMKKNYGIKVFSKGKAKGEIVAGNMQTLLALSGTSFMPEVSGKILFLEDDETCSPALISRFFQQFKDIGWFEKISGIIIGRFTEQSKFTFDNSLEKLLEEYFQDTEIPILYDVDFGHSDPIITIPNGGYANIDAEKKEILFRRSVI